MADIAALPANAALKAQRKGLSETWFASVLIAPALLFIGVIVAWPLLETIRLSFTDASLAGETFVGLKNYADLMNSSKFYDIVGRTFFWMFISVGLKLFIGLIGATLLKRYRSRQGLVPHPDHAAMDDSDCHGLPGLALALQRRFRHHFGRCALAWHHRWARFWAVTSGTRSSSQPASPSLR